MDWVDSTESQRILQFQRHAFDDFVREVPSAFGPARHLRAGPRAPGATTDAVPIALLQGYCMRGRRHVEATMTKKFASVHPGEVLLEEFLKPMEISQYKLAKDISVHPRRVNEIAHGKRSISADTALRLSRYFGLSERFWLNLQARYDLEVEKDRLEGRLEDEVKVLVASPSAHAGG